MALHDFWCQTCGQVLLDVNVPIAIGAAGAPVHCDRPTAWIVGRMDAASGPGFQAFETYGGQNRPVTVDSLQKLRDIERESEADARDGRGQPIVWRRYAQNATNRDVHAIARKWTGGAQPDPTAQALGRRPTNLFPVAPLHFRYCPRLSDYVYFAQNIQPIPRQQPTK